MSNLGELTTKLKMLLFFSMFIFWGSCSSDEDELYYTEISDNYIIHCPEPPIEIMSSTDEESVARGEKLLNYFKILQISENLYYMYYEAFKGEIVDTREGVYFAYSTDCKHWIKQFPLSTDADNTVIPNNIIGVDVIKVPDEKNPFRMFATRLYEGEYGLFMLKSKDGFKFSDEKKVLSGLYDTQNVAVIRNDTIKLYLRKWKDDINRANGYINVDLEGNLLSSIYMLRDNYLYNSAASIYAEEKYDFLFPTYFNTIESMGCSLKAYIVEGYNSKEIPWNINSWLANDELWAIVSPGILTIDGDHYIAYNTRNWFHDEKMPEGGVSKYKLIKIKIGKL